MRCGVAGAGRLRQEAEAVRRVLALLFVRSTRFLLYGAVISRIRASFVGMNTITLHFRVDTVLPAVGHGRPLAGSAGNTTFLNAFVDALRFDSGRCSAWLGIKVRTGCSRPEISA